MIKKLCIIVLSILFTGCIDIGKKYIWIREDGDVFTLKYRIGENNKFYGIQTYIPSERSSAVIKTPDIRAISHFDPCIIVDKRNFECFSSVTDGKEKIVMNDGILVYNYWTEQRVYKEKIDIKFTFFD